MAKDPFGHFLAVHALGCGFGFGLQLRFVFGLLQDLANLVRKDVPPPPLHVKFLLVLSVVISIPTITDDDQ